MPSQPPINDFLTELRQLQVADLVNDTNGSDVRAQLKFQPSEKDADIVELLRRMESAMELRREAIELRREPVTAFALQGFEIGIDIDGLLVMRLDHRQDGMRHQTTYALDFEQALQFVTGLVRAAEEAEKFRNCHDIRQ